jgi:hypothetical protein
MLSFAFIIRKNAVFKEFAAKLTNSIYFKNKIEDFFNTKLLNIIEPCLEFVPMKSPLWLKKENKAQKIERILV